MVARVADDTTLSETERKRTEELLERTGTLVHQPSLSSNSEDPKNEPVTIIGKLRDEFLEPAVVIFGHAVLIVFGVLVLSFLGWLVDHSHISSLAKEILHIIDEYLMIFAFVILGFSFIIKIVTVVLGGARK